MDDEPHFGEVWKWENLGPFMIVSRSPLDGNVNVWTLADDGNRLRMISLVWDQQGHTFRENWHRLDTEELG